MKVDLSYGIFSWNNKAFYYLKDYTIGLLFYNGLKIDLNKISKCGWNKEDFLAAISFYDKYKCDYELCTHDLKTNLDKYLELVAIRDIIE